MNAIKTLPLHTKNGISHILHDLVFVTISGLFYQQNQQIEIKVTRNQDQPFSIQIHLEANKGNKGNKCKSNNSYQK